MELFSYLVAIVHIACSLTKLKKMIFSYLPLVWTIAMAIFSINAETEPKKRSTCREPEILQNFDVTRILGHWYEYSRHHHDFEDGCDCFTSEVVAIDANTLQISNCCQMTKVSNATQKCNIGINEARLTNPEKKEASFQYTRTGGKYNFCWSFQR